MARFLTKEEIQNSIPKPSLGGIVSSSVAIGLRTAYAIRQKTTKVADFKSNAATLPVINPKTFTSTKHSNTNRTWNIQNLSTGEIVTGIYGGDMYTETGTSSYAEYSALGREYPIQKFLHGEIETCTFTGIVYAKHTGQYQDVSEQVAKLKQWSRMDKNTGKPPIIGFFIGDGSAVNYAQAILKASLKYKHLDVNGFTVSYEVDIEIKRYEPFTFETRNFDTKYHYGIDGEYHDLLAAKEYGNPMLGVALRALNEQSEINDGDIVKLPAPKGSITKYKIKEYSVILNGLSNKKLEKSREILNDLIAERYSQYSTSYSVSN